MADRQAGKVFNLFERATPATYGMTPIADQPAQLTGSGFTEKAFAISDSEVIKRLMEEMARIPEEGRNALLHLLQGPLIRQTDQETAHDDIFLLPVEDEPVVSQEQHATNVERLQRLKMIRPDTEDDLIAMEQ